jgi:signal transduction histidine kinase
MSQPRFSRRESVLITAVTYLALVAVAIGGTILAPDRTTQWVTIILVAIFGLVVTRIPSSESPAWQQHLYLAVQVVVVAILMYVHSEWTIFVFLYFILCAQAVLLLPLRVGAMWIAGLILITGAFGTLKWGRWLDGLLTALLYSAGYGFFAIIAHALARADRARRESQALLTELQKAHQQLHEYALRIEELAVIQERSRLAREMHDTLGHRLTVASVQLEGAQRLCSLDPDRAASMVGVVRGEVREALNELRSTVATLRTPIEADLELRHSLLLLVDRFEEATGLTVHRILPQDLPDLPNAHRLAIYRAAQEGLTNVQKHASASQAWLMLDARDNTISLLVSDDGQGLSLNADRTNFGVRGLRERAAQLGGEMHLESRPGGGTQLSILLPLPAECDDG